MRKNQVSFFSKNASKVDHLDIKVLFGFKEMPKDSIYLGNILLVSRNETKDFNILKDRIN